MAVAGTDRESESAIGIGRGVEVADGMDDMIKASGHRRIRSGCPQPFQQVREWR
jgi:hypothetical protein